MRARIEHDDRQRRNIATRATSRRSGTWRNSHAASNTGTATAKLLDLRARAGDCGSKVHSEAVETRLPSWPKLLLAHAPATIRPAPRTPEAA